MNTISHLHVGLVLLLVVLILPLFASVAERVVPNNSYTLDGGWGKFFLIQNDFLVAVESAKSTVKHLWLPLGIYFGAFYGLLWVFLTSQPKEISNKT